MESINLIRCNIKGKLDETYDTIRKKFEFMGVPKNGAHSSVSRNVNPRQNVVFDLCRAGDFLSRQKCPQFSEELNGFTVTDSGFDVRVSIFVAPHDVDEAAELKIAVHNWNS